MNLKLKQINFLCGLPRSGSSLLSNLLNQHPRIYASPHSALLESYVNLYQTITNSEAVKFGLRIGQYQAALWTLPQIFYQDVESDIIIDKQFAWSTPDNYNLALKISGNPHFILTYRPILEVLASFVDKAQKNENFYLNKELDNSNNWNKNYLSRNDAMAEYLMSPEGVISKSILALSFAKQNEKSGKFKFVAYDELVTQPEKIVADIFDFLGVDPILLKTDNLVNDFRYHEENVTGDALFHVVNSRIKKLSTNPENLFSDYILSKYNNALAPIGL